MKVVHRLKIFGRCPVNNDHDSYECVVVVHRQLSCESIIAAIERLTKEPIYQERLTEELSLALDAYVKTTGKHVGGRVATTVVCRPLRR